MLDSNTILGTRHFLDCDEYEHGLLTQNNEMWPCGTPVVYPANSLRKGVEFVQVYTIMPPNQHAGHGYEVSRVDYHAVSPIGLKPLYGNHKILTVSNFDVDKFGRLLEFVRDVGGLSLIVEYEEGRRQLSESIRQLERLFKYCAPFSYNVWSDKQLWSKDDKFICALTFLDLPYCVPLFNMRKVDGIGLSFCGATVEASLKHGFLSRTFRADLIYSNYEDNVFFVDGIAVNSIKRPNSSFYSEIERLTVKYPEIGKPDELKQRMFGVNYGEITAPPSAIPTDSPEEVEVAVSYESDGPEVAAPSLNAEISVSDGKVTYYTTTGEGFNVDFDSSNADGEPGPGPENENH